MTPSIHTKFWIMQPFQPNNFNTQFYQSLLFLRNVKFAPDLDLAIEGLESEVLQEIISLVQQWQIIKVLISMHVHDEFANPNQDPQRYFKADFKASFTAFFYLYDNNNLVGYWPIVHLIAERLIQNNANFIREISGLVVADIVTLETRIVQSNPLVGASYNKLPPLIKNKHAVVNARNLDNGCFGYAMLAAILNIHMHSERVNIIKKSILLNRNSILLIILLYQQHKI